MQVIQDGRRFYDNATGDELFESSIIVHDGNLSDAQSARVEFVDWANRSGLVVEFVLDPPGP